MKSKKILSSLLVFCMLLVPSSVVFAQTSNAKTVHEGASGVLNMTSTTSGTTSAGSVLNEITPNTVSGGAGSGGVDTLNCIAIGSKILDADWTLSSSSGPITFLATRVVFDNGVGKTFSYSCFGANQHNSAQATFKTTVPPPATFAGGGTVDFMIDFTCTPLTDYDYVY